MKTNKTEPSRVYGKHNSQKSIRVLLLTWHIKNNRRVSECLKMLNNMGLNEYGRKM